MNFRPIPNSIFYGVILLGLLPVVLFALGLLPIHHTIRDRQSPGMQSAHALGLAIWSYANDNNGNYPDGKSSTEVFQNLMDGGYIADPGEFYIDLPGKTKPVKGQRVKPENVCWDFTGGVSTSDSDSIPLVFPSGFRIHYSSGGSAVPLVKPAHRYYVWPRSLSRWWLGYPEERTLIEDGIPAFYKNNTSRFGVLKTAANGADIIPNFVPTDFDAKGKTYRQLTPDGVLAP